MQRGLGEDSGIQQVAQSPPSTCPRCRRLPSPTRRGTNGQALLVLNVQVAVRTEKLICQAQRLQRGMGRGWRKREFRSAWVEAHGHNKSLCLSAPVRANTYCGKADYESGAAGQEPAPCNPCRSRPKGAGHLALLACWTRSLCHGGRPVRCGVFPSTPASTLWTPAAHSTSC